MFMYPRPTAYDPRTASPNTQVTVAVLVTARYNPHKGVSVTTAEKQVREGLARENHDPAYIESAIQYAYSI